MVELLAVIAILGLILVIAVPKVLNVINDSKKETMKLNVHSIIKFILIV